MGTKAPKTKAAGRLQFVQRITVQTAASPKSHRIQCSVRLVITACGNRFLSCERSSCQFACLSFVREGVLVCVHCCRWICTLLCACVRKLPRQRQITILVHLHSNLTWTPLDFSYAWCCRTSYSQTCHGCGPCRFRKGHGALLWALSKYAHYYVNNEEVYRCDSYRKR